MKFYLFAAPSDENFRNRFQEFEGGTLVLSSHFFVTNQ